MQPWCKEINLTCDRMWVWRACTRELTNSASTGAGSVCGTSESASFPMAFLFWWPTVVSLCVLFPGFDFFSFQFDFVNGNA
jgi:hypothetical protein